MVVFSRMTHFLGEDQKMGEKGFGAKIGGGPKCRFFAFSSKIPWSMEGDFSMWLKRAFLWGVPFTRGRMR